MEAEYMAMAEAAKQAIWLRQLLEDLGLGQGDKPLPLWNDNAGATALSKNPTSHDKSKHIAMRHHFIREKVLDNTVSLSHVPSAENLADLLTKSLPAENFGRLCDLLGVRRRSAKGSVGDVISLRLPSRPTQGPYCSALRSLVYRDQNDLFLFFVLSCNLHSNSFGLRTVPPTTTGGNKSGVTKHSRTSPTGCFMG